MHERTLNTLDELEKADWFGSVGKMDSESALVLSSWGEAIESCSSDDWQNLLLEASNRYTEQLMKNSMERFRQWNSIVDEVKPVTMDLVKRKIAKVSMENQLPKIFEDTVNWDMLHLAMEAEFADVYPPGFFASQGYWYVHGHFPCGWKGNFPEGELVIF